MATSSSYARIGTTSPTDKAMLAAIGAFVALIVTVLGGAELASLLASAKLLAAGDHGAGAALIHLPQHLARPALAWPIPDRAELPGAPAYWACTLAVVMALCGLAYTAARAFGASGLGASRRVRLGVETQARLARKADLVPLIVKRATPGRLILGRVSGHLVATEDRSGAPTRRAGARQGDRGAVCIIGPTRCGKTANTISGALEWEGPAILSSVKADFLDATLARRQTLGEVRVFDPTASTDQTGSMWSPLRDCGHVTGAQRAARALVACAPKSGAEHMDFFRSMAENLLWPLLFAAAATGREMADVVRWVLTEDCPDAESSGEVASLLDELLSHKDDAVAKAAAAAMMSAGGVWNLPAQTRGGTYATVQTLVSGWTDPAVARSAGRCEIDLEWLLTPGQANTLYICAPIDDQSRLAAVFGGLLGDLFNQAYAKFNHVGTLRPTLVVLDEAGNTPTAWLPQVASTCAGIGLLLVTIWQSRAQIDAAYGRLADSVVTNHLTKLIFSGLTDASTLDWAARLLGDEEVTQRSGTWAPSGMRSTSESTVRVPLVASDVLRRMAPHEALLLHATLRPAHLRTRPWYAERALRELASRPTPRGGSEQ
jgi:type IV secretion system protein VirD4